MAVDVVLLVCDCVWPVLADVCADGPPGLAAPGFAAPPWARAGTETRVIALATVATAKRRDLAMKTSCFDSGAHGSRRMNQNARGWPFFPS